uniref:Triacylglycerol lipase n=2 Tax=Opuntia streptacantha TaxID=393608 RepID=A0A7C9DTR2_OPUST
MQSIQRLRTIKTSVWRSVGMPELRKRAANSWSAVQDTYYSTKDTFERHRVVFTIGTSIASAATALIGYSLRHVHETRVARRLDSIEAAMKNNYQIEREEIKKIVHTGSLSTEACIATAGTTLVVGYALGWRGGKWYANRKFRSEQMKLLGHIKPRRWRLQFIKRPNFQFIRIPLIGNKSSKSTVNSSEALQKERSKPSKAVGNS